METLQDTLDKMMDIDGVKTDGETVQVENGQTVEIGGVKFTQITDKKGRVWSVPADDSNVDSNEGAFRNILSIPDPEPNFYYQYVGDDRLRDYLSRDFALVEPDEVGLPTAHSDAKEMASAAIGIRPSSHHQVGNLHLVKIPKALERRYRIAQKMRADEATAGIKKARHTDRNGKAISEDVKVQQAETKTVRGKPIVTAQPGFKEYPEETP